jgi:hypothetical protein
VRAFPTFVSVFNLFSLTYTDIRVIYFLHSCHGCTTLGISVTTTTAATTTYNFERDGHFLLQTTTFNSLCEFMIHLSLIDFKGQKIS